MKSQESSHDEYKLPATLKAAEEIQAKELNLLDGKL